MEEQRPILSSRMKTGLGRRSYAVSAAVLVFFAAVAALTVYEIDRSPTHAISIDFK